MSTPRCSRSAARIERLVLPILLVMACGSAHALKSDRDQLVDIHANEQMYNQQKGVLVLSGDVKLDQGSFHADGDKADGYTDPNDNSQWERVVLTGAPAHFRQKQDDGTLVHGEAQKIDYKVSEDTVILTGNASVVQEGKGEFHGATLTYHTDTGQMTGAGGEGGQVHIVLQPKKKAAATAKPAASSSGAAPVQPAPAASATPPTASSTH